MPTNEDTVITPPKTLDDATSLVSDTKISSTSAINGIDINALVDSRVQQKLQELLGPLLIQLSNNARDNLQGRIDKEPSEHPDVAQQPNGTKSIPGSEINPDRIQFVERDRSKRDKLSPWIDPRNPPLLEETQNWLIVTKVVNNQFVAYEITLSDKTLRDRIKELLSSFIAHKGESAWQRDEVVLVSEIDTLVLNYRILEAETVQQPADKTRHRLGELLDILRVLYPPQFTCIEADIHKDFRIEMKYVWPLFCPGKLIVANKHGLDSPQLLRIDQYNLIMEDQQTAIIVSAWMWDWDGQKLVRSMYEFMKVSPEHARVNPKEWDFYPLEFHEASDGSRGLDALRQDEALRRRRRVFIEYTGEYAAKYQGANVLRYSGDAFGDMTAFPPAEMVGSMPVPLLRLPRSMRNERAEKKLIKLDEDIVLDTENYCRRVGKSRKFADQELGNSKFCECSLCMDRSTEIWYKKMAAISKAQGTKLELAISEAVNMEFDINDFLLPPRVFGFALNKKEWCQFSLEKIQRSQTLKFENEGSHVDGLVFPPNVMEEERRDIFKLVSGHRRVMSHHRRISDTIDGKGESLILLFHGHSGTGKTLYAESLAKACRLGLFKVGTNDIGLEVAHAERRLKEIFELAESWNTILLIDEADVLLDTRGRENESLVSKNALVSVLLREVEYFKGILIMTTNRVRAFDPAILSRIHHAVDFEGSTQKQEEDLWNLWYDRMEREQACVNGPEIRKWMRDTNRKKKRNFLTGREIRNVFLTAQVLAEDERKGIKIGRDELERAYHYKDNFLAETEGKINEAKAMVMSGMKQ